MTEACAVRLMGRRGQRLFLPAVGSVVLTAALTGAAQPSASQSVTSISGFLNAVTTVSASDAWAVGDAVGPHHQPLIVHWDGTSWSRMRSPGAPNGNLYGVSMVSASDGWAVGDYPSAHGLKLLALHWDGTSWTKQSVSDLTHGALYGVNMVSASDGWAVGEQPQRTRQVTLLLHWDGTSWGPVFSASGVLRGVSAAPGPTGWAVGSNPQGPQLVRGRGVTWTPVFGLPSRDNLLGVSAASASDAWAVGFLPPASTSQKGVTLTLHWNGRAWHRVSSLSPGRQVTGSSINGNELAAVADTSPSNAWAVGDYTLSTGAQAALTLHWNGAKWTRVANQGGHNGSFLRGVSMVSPADGWAVGGKTSTNKVIILHWNGTSWTRS